jgi:hypothetical protein
MIFNVSLDSDSSFHKEKIRAIKAFRTATGWGLKDSKHVIDNIVNTSTPFEVNLPSLESAKLLRESGFVVGDNRRNHLQEATDLLKKSMQLLLDADESHYLILIANAYKQMQEEIAQNTFSSSV